MKNKFLLPKTQKAFLTFEFLLTILILSIVTISSMYFIKEINFKNKETLNKQILNLDLKSTKIFLQKNNTNLQSNLKLKDKKLLFKDTLLIDNINHFNLTNYSDYYKINLETKNKKLEWIILK